MKMHNKCQIVLPASIRKQFNREVGDMVKPYFINDEAKTTGVFKLKAAAIRDIMQGLLIIPGFSISQKAILNANLDIWEKTRRDFVDASIVASAMSKRNRRIHSLNKGLDNITDFRIELS